MYMLGVSGPELLDFVQLEQNSLHVSNANTSEPEETNITQKSSFPTPIIPPILVTNVVGLMTILDHLMSTVSSN